MDSYVLMFGLIFIAVFLIVVAVVLLALSKKVKRWQTDDASPVLSVEATLVKKEDKGYSAEYVDDEGYYDYQKVHRYYLTFEVDGEFKVFQVEEEEFEDAQDGYFGILRFQGSRYIKFEAQSQRYFVG